MFKIEEKEIEELFAPENPKTLQSKPSRAKTLQSNPLRRVETPLYLVLGPTKRLGRDLVHP